MSRQPQHSRALRRGRFRAPSSADSFPVCYERLEDRCLLSGANFSLVKTDLGAILGKLQTAVTGEVLGKTMPLLGSNLQSSSQAKFLPTIQDKITS
jgi:hypothetical protein